MTDVGGGFRVLDTLAATLLELGEVPAADRDARSLPDAEGD